MSRQTITRRITVYKNCIYFGNVFLFYYCGIFVPYFIPVYITIDIYSIVSLKN